MCCSQVAHPEHASSSIAVPPKERFERLLAEAEQCIRARSASPLLRPLTPQHDVGLDSSKLEQNAIVRLPAATTCIATAAGGSSAAAQSPLTQVSQLHRFRGQERSQGPLLPPLELPAAATTTTSAPGSRLRAGGLLGTSAAAAQHCIAGVSNDKVQELKQVGVLPTAYRAAGSCWCLPHSCPAHTIAAHAWSRALYALGTRL